MAEEKKVVLNNDFLMIKLFFEPMMYPLKLMSTMMQATPSDYYSAARKEAVETKLYQKTSNLRVSANFPSNTLWKYHSRIASVYNDCIGNSLGEGIGVLYKGFFISSFLQFFLSKDFYVIMQTTSLTEHIKIYLGLVSFSAIQKPLKTAYTRFVMQNCKQKTYEHLYIFFMQTRIREMYQGFTMTLAKDTAFYFAYAIFGSLSAFYVLFYPLMLAETRLEAMSSSKSMHPQRYTSANILPKIFFEEGVRGLFKGGLLFGMYQSFFAFAKIISLEMVMKNAKTLDTETETVE